MQDSSDESLGIFFDWRIARLSLIGSRRCLMMDLLLSQERVTWTMLERQTACRPSSQGNIALDPQTNGRHLGLFAFWLIVGGYPPLSRRFRPFWLSAGPIRFQLRSIQLQPGSWRFKHQHCLKLARKYQTIHSNLDWKGLPLRECAPVFHTPPKILAFCQDRSGTS